MSVGRTIQATFSRYEIAVGRVLSLWFFLVLGVYAAANGRFAIAVVLLLTGAILNLWLMELSRCPACGKSPLLRSRGEVAWPLYRMAARRLWPERQCSECGTELGLMSE
jgi:hypothetical protein